MNLQWAPTRSGTPRQDAHSVEAFNTYRDCVAEAERRRATFKATGTPCTVRVYLRTVKAGGLTAIVHLLVVSPKPAPRAQTVEVVRGDPNGTAHSDAWSVVLHGKRRRDSTTLESFGSLEEAQAYAARWIEEHPKEPRT